MDIFETFKGYLFDPSHKYCLFLVNQLFDVAWNVSEIMFEIGGSFGDPVCSVLKSTEETAAIHS